MLMENITWTITFSSTIMAHGIHCLEPHASAACSAPTIQLLVIQRALKMKTVASMFSSGAKLVITARVAVILIRVTKQVRTMANTDREMTTAFMVTTAA